MAGGGTARLGRCVFYREQSVGVGADPPGSRGRCSISPVGSGCSGLKRQARKADIESPATRARCTTLIYPLPWIHGSDCRHRCAGIACAGNPARGLPPACSTRTRRIAGGRDRTRTRRAAEYDVGAPRDSRPCWRGPVGAAKSLDRLSGRPRDASRADPVSRQGLLLRPRGTVRAADRGAGAVLLSGEKHG